MKKTLGVFCIILPLIPLLSLSQEKTAPDGTVRPIDEVLTDYHEKRGGILVSLNECVEIALAENLDVKIERFNLDLSEASIMAEKAAFDPSLGFRFTNREATQPTATTLDAAVSSTEDVDFSVTWAQKLRYGADYNVNFYTTKSDTNSPFATFNPNYYSSLQVSYSQPLLKNFGRRANTYGIEIARNNLEISRLQLEQRITDIVESVLNAYWDLVYTIENLSVQEMALHLAEELLRQNKIMVEVGTLAPIDVVEAEAGVASRKESVIVAENAIRDAEDLLRRFLNIKRGSEMWELPLVPTDIPIYEEYPVNEEKAIERALASRPELKEIDIDVVNQEKRIAFYRNQLKPTLDLVFTGNTAGLGGDLLSTVSDADLYGRYETTDSGVFVDLPMPDGSLDHPNDIDYDGDGEFDSYSEFLHGNWQDSLEGLRTLDFLTWSIALELTIPIGNKAAKANYASAKTTYEQKRYQREQTVQNIKFEVREAVRGILTDRKRVEAAWANVKWQEEKLDAEEKKFENGMSTNYNVLQAQEEFSVARNSRDQAILDYMKSIIQFEKAMGNLLEKRNISIR